MAYYRFLICAFVFIFSSSFFAANVYARPDDAIFDNLSDPPPEYEISLPPSFWKPGMIIKKEIYRREEGLEIRGVVPVLDIKSDTVHYHINEHLEKSVGNRIFAAKEARARSITFEYKMYETAELVSVIVSSTTISATSKTEVFSVNINKHTGDLMSLSEAAGAGIAPLAEKLLTEMMRRNPERYSASFNTASLNAQPFYLTDDQAVLLFDEFQLLATADGIKELKLELGQISKVIVHRWEYRVQSDGYNLKMVPLRKVIEGLAYTLDWNETVSRATISRDGAILIEIEPGINNYEVIDKKIRSLEAAPISMDGKLFVPITFFDQIMHLVTYTVDEWEDITFLSYTE